MEEKVKNSVICHGGRLVDEPHLFTTDNGLKFEGGDEWTFSDV